MSGSSSFDVIIVGGGLVGLSAAAALGRADFRVALVEAGEPQMNWPEDSIDLRVYAISRVSEQLFRELGAWPAMQERACPYRDMHVWDAGGRGEIHFDSAELGEPGLGHIIESRVIERALLKVVERLPGVQRICPARVQDFSKNEQSRQVVLEDGRLLSTTLLIGADGKHSRVRDHEGIHLQVSDYGQQALVTVVTTEKSHRETAWQRFLPTGPLAFLPLHDGRCSIVWSATTREAQRLLALDDATFCDELGKAFDLRLGRITACGERALFPLQKQHASAYVKPRLALVGDAAHVIHPLAGQGVNLGLKDVRELAAVLGDARVQGRDIGSFNVLRRYERARKGDNLVMMTAMDAFKHLFGSRAVPLRWARNAGLNLVDAAPLLKRQIMRAAMGL